MNKSISPTRSGYAARPKSDPNYLEKINHDHTSAVARRQDLHALMRLYGDSLTGGREEQDRFMELLARLYREHRGREADKKAAQRRGVDAPRSPAKNQVMSEPP